MTRERRDSPHVPMRHFMREVDGRPARYHLRFEPDGTGLLLANAQSALRLSESGRVMAEWLLQGGAVRDVAARIDRRYVGVDYDTALADARRLTEVMDAMALPSSAFPLRSLDDPSSTLHRRMLAAPLAAEIDAGETGRVPDMLRALWEIGVPQVNLLLPSGTPGGHLPRLVEVAEDLGMIAGLRARASDLSERGLLAGLAEAGLDHLDVYWGGPDAAAHDGLFGGGDHARAEALFGRATALEVCPVAVLPLLADTLDALEDVGVALARLRVPVVVAYAVVEEDAQGRVLDRAYLPQTATTLEEEIEHDNINLIWAPPQERDPSQSLGEQVAGGPRAAGEATIRVRADGSVLSPEGPAVVTGDLLHDAWDAIWEHEAFTVWRTSADDPERCDMCPGLALCDAGCPADPSTWARLAPDPEGGR